MKQLGFSNAGPISLRNILEWHVARGVLRKSTWRNGSRFAHYQVKHIKLKTLSLI